MKIHWKTLSHKVALNKKINSILGSSFLQIILFGFFSYIFEDERGVFPECEFVYDLELPSDYSLYKTNI
jgi:hypothetical protein